MQNIPSHATDIRHMFRATPPMDKVLACVEDESEITVALGRYDKVYTPNGMKTVNTLSVGDEVILKNNEVEVVKVVKRLEDTDTDPGLCNVVF